MMMFVPTFSPVLVTSLVCFFVVVEKGSSFTALSPSRRSFCTCSSDQRSTRSALFAGRKDDNIRSSNSDFPPDEDTVEYTGSVDWDAEWKKVVKNGGVASGERPGKEFYKSEAEIAAIVSIVSRLNKVDSRDLTKMFSPSSSFR